jgi:hypothetical protein
VAGETVLKVFAGGNLPTEGANGAVRRPRAHSPAPYEILRAVFPVPWRAGINSAHVPAASGASGSAVHEFVESHCNDDSSYNYDFDNQRAFHEEMIPDGGSFWNKKRCIQKNLCNTTDYNQSFKINIQEKSSIT